MPSKPAVRKRAAALWRTVRSFRIFLLLLTAMGLAGCLERLFFYPDSATYARPEQYGLRHDDVFIDTADGARLHGWWLPARGPALGSVLHLHGNAANVSNHLPLVASASMTGTAAASAMFARKTSFSACETRSILVTTARSASESIAPILRGRFMPLVASSTTRPNAPTM